MSQVLSRREDCRLCGRRDLQLALPLAPSPIGDGFVPKARLTEAQPSYPLDVYLCNGCGHVQLLDVLDPGVLYNDYIYVTTSSPGLPAHFQKYADATLSRLSPPQGSLFVDIGSNDGTLLSFFRQKGMRVLGVEPASEIARAATASGIETLPMFFDQGVASEILAKRGPAAVVTANNLFANVDDLTALVSGIRSLLAQDGVFIVETGYLTDLIKSAIFDNVYHEHLGYHSLTPLVEFFGNQDMEVIDAMHVQSKGGSLRVMVQPAGGPRPVSASVEEMMSEEQSIGVHRISTFRSLQDKLDSVRTRLTALIDEVKAEGKIVVGYGASHSVTTLMYHFGLPGRLTFMVDDNPIKQGLYSPGCHIPVLPPQALYEQKPDYVVILAWRFAEAIIKNHQDYLEQNGHFIVPLPQVDVI